MKNNSEKKWKRGDIGPDGRLFWCYKKSYRNGEWWASPDAFDELKSRQKTNDARHANSPRREATRQSPEYKEKDKLRKQSLEYKEKDKLRKQSLEYKDWKKSYERSDRHRSHRKNYYQTPEYKELGRRKNLRKSFSKNPGASIDSFLRSLAVPTHTLSAIMDLRPDDGQSLAKLIHELSGYEMSVCQEIADLCSPEIETESPGE